MAKTRFAKKPNIVKKRNPLGITRIGSSVFKGLHSLASSLFTNIPSSLGLLLSSFVSPPPTSDRCWATLDADILSKIFTYLPPDELHFKASLVCRSWRLTSWEVLFWQNTHTVDLNSLGDIVQALSSDLPIEENGKSRHSLILYKGVKAMTDNRLVLGNKQRNITTIIFPDNMIIRGNNDLAWFASRTQHVKRVELKNASWLMKNCFSKALTYWNYLEELEIGPARTFIMKHIIKELGINCKNLHALHICTGFRAHPIRCFSLRERNANAIATHLDQLREFSMMESKLYKDGVAIILSRCKQLSNVRFERCAFISIEGVKTASMRKQILEFSGSECFKWSLESKPLQLFTSDEVVRHLFR